MGGQGWPAAKGCPPPKIVKWEFGRITGCLQLCQDPSLSSAPMHEHTQFMLAQFGSILHSVTLMASVSSCCGLCQTGWAWLLMLRGLCAPFAPLQYTPQHILPDIHPKTQHDSETPPACAPYWQHSHVLGCAHRFLCTYLCTHTHANTCMCYLHVYLCPFTRAHKFARSHVHSSIFTPCVQTYTAVPTHMCSQRHLCTGMYSQGHTEMCQHAGRHECAHMCARTRMCSHTCMHTAVHTLYVHTEHKLWTHTCTSVHTICACTHAHIHLHVHMHRRVSTQVCACAHRHTTHRHAPPGGGRDPLKEWRQRPTPSPVPPIPTPYPPSLALYPLSPLYTPHPLPCTPYPVAHTLYHCCRGQGHR